MPPSMGPRKFGTGGKATNIKQTIKQLAYYFRNYKSLFIFALVLSFIAGACVTIALVFNGIIYSKYIIPWGMVDGKEVTAIDWGKFGLVSFLYWCGGIIITYLIGYGFNWIETYILLRMSENGCYSLRNAIFEKLKNLPIGYFDRTPSGDIMSRTINDSTNIGMALSQYLGNLVYWFVTGVSIIIVMFFINPVLSCIALITIPLAMVITVLVMRTIRPYFAKQQKAIGDLNGISEEKISGLKIISLFQMKNTTQEEFKKANEILTKNSIIAQASSSMMMPVNIFANNIGFVIFASVGAYGMFKGGHGNNGFISPDWGLIKFPLPSDAWFHNLLKDGHPLSDPDIIQIKAVLEKITLLIVFTNMMRNSSNQINQLAGSLGSMFSALASAERVLEIIKMPVEVDDPEAVTLKQDDVYGLIEAENLNFSYVQGKQILKDINFYVRPNEVIALVGPTGAGKTTIVNLITRFYDIDSGNLWIDGIAINKINRESLRQNVTMVLQDTYLFSDTILENIRYGRLNATDEEVKQSAKLAYADNFIMQMPNGYGTVLEDNGSNLSLGQRQLLSISRAFLSNAKIVILDEATSSIDTKTELLIQKSMSKLIENKTAFVIAHRLSTIMNANQILVIRDGTIVERGTHKQLLDVNGFYAELYNSQFKKGMEI